MQTIITILYSFVFFSIGIMLDEYKVITDPIWFMFYGHVGGLVFGGLCVSMRYFEKSKLRG